MTRKDSEKDSERPHYYSQFWLDIAAGRRTIGTPKPEDENEPAETESTESELEPASAWKADQADESVVSPAYNGADEPERDEEPARVATYEQEETAVSEDEVEYPASENLPVAEADIPDVDLETSDQEEEQEEQEPFAEEEEEEEEDLNWGRGRKKAKPVRPVKPVGKKPGKRDTRRSF